jgi:DNA mismatch repair protein MutH
MERDEALEKLKKLAKQNLHALAVQFEVTVRTPAGKVNKGWAGHVFERYLGIPINSSQSPNFGSWELKSISLKYKRDGSLGFKETMAVTMIDPYQVVRTPFDQSHLLSKLKKAICVARTVGASVDDPSYIHSVSTIDLNGELYDAVQHDYEEVQKCISDPQRGFTSLSGSMGVYIQPRPKGPGHGSTSRAFYARPLFLQQFIKI